MNQSIFRTILIDDEEPARLRLRQLLKTYTRIQIIGEARDGIEAVDMINRENPDLIFLDIQMSGKDGFEVIKSLTTVPYIIFCTAFDQYALQAFETNSIDYLVKPVKAERLEMALQKLFNIGKPGNNTAITALVEQMFLLRKPEPLTSFPVKTGDKVIFLKLTEIAYLEATDKYVEIHTVSGKHFLLDQSLNYLEDKLPGNFLRVHRAIIINTDLIKEVRRYLASKYSITLDDANQTRIITGRSYNEQIKRLMNV